MRVVTKPCYSGPLLKDNNPVQFLTGQYEDQNEEKAVTMRSHFPETWLWELVPVSGHLQLKRHLPHSITSWLTNVLCISEHEGIGFSPETELKSFQSFFVEIITPYSVKRSEMFHLLIHVNNYLGYRFPVRLTLRLSDGLELDNSAQDLSTSFCLSENDTMTYTFHVKGTKTRSRQRHCFSRIRSSVSRRMWTRGYCVSEGHIPKKISGRTRRLPNDCNEIRTSVYFRHSYF
ncbi:hypothetical protein NQ318_001786 [Aromia moschata]|uniref:Alpha-2-macroglobulin domain-containing protein n=1 Tax=Aromia moschata TaxID=1265417 RepID=A0AAV8XID3_9CUCU|nr:hypothetical protein NQ318_001786 [Aromia moschata]